MGKLFHRRFFDQRVWEQSKGLAQGLLNSVRFLARALEDSQDNGVNHNAWLNPLQQAQTDELKPRQMGDLLKEAPFSNCTSRQNDQGLHHDGVALQKMLPACGKVRGHGQGLFLWP